jgi:hypothetical protein
MNSSIAIEFSWLVSVSNIHHTWTRVSAVSPTAIRHIKKSFTTLGFSILEMPNDYYNPTIKRFIVKHSKASAITLWNLQHTNLLQRGVTVEPQFDV